MTPIKQFDIVILKSVKNVDYVSGPAGRPATPRGRWIVTWADDKNPKLLLAKDETIIQIPKDDVIKIGDYSVQKVFELVKRVRSTEDFNKLFGAKDERKLGAEGEGIKEE